MNESLDKLLQCLYASDFGTVEIPSMIEYKKRAKNQKKSASIFKKIFGFDTYLEVIPRTIPKSWIIRKIEHSNEGIVIHMGFLEKLMKILDNFAAHLLSHLQ